MQPGLRSLDLDLDELLTRLDQTLDQLDLPSVINGMAGYAQHEVESLCFGQR